MNVECYVKPNTYLKLDLRNYQRLFNPYGSVVDCS